MTIIVSCKCDEYNKNASQIFQAQHLASYHGLNYTGKIFVFCPWCGEELYATEENPSTAEPKYDKDKSEHGCEACSHLAYCICDD